MRYPRAVYAIQHNVTDRIYVGSTSNLKSRLQSHRSSLRRGGHGVADMQSDYAKYGENFTVYLLDIIHDPKADRKEFEWMHRLQSHIRGKGYNYNEGSTSPVWKVDAGDAPQKSKYESIGIFVETWR